MSGDIGVVVEGTGSHSPRILFTSDGKEDLMLRGQFTIRLGCTLSELKILQDGETLQDTTVTYLYPGPVDPPHVVCSIKRVKDDLFIRIVNPSPARHTVWRGMVSYTNLFPAA